MAKLLFVLWVVVLLIGFGAVVEGGAKMLNGAGLLDILPEVVVMTACALIAPILKRVYDLIKPIDQNQIPKESL